MIETELEHASIKTGMERARVLFLSFFIPKNQRRL